MCGLEETPNKSFSKVFESIHRVHLVCGIFLAFFAYQIHEEACHI